MKTCRKCSTFLSLEFFSKNSQSTDGLNSRCKSCVKLSRIPHVPKANPATCSSCDQPHPLGHTGRRRKCKSCRDKVWEENRRREGLDPEILRHRLFRKEGSEEAKIFLERVFGTCEICGKSEKPIEGIKAAKLCVDHCHTTGKIRGILCRGCNTALGSFRDNLESLRSAVKYLENHNEKHNTL